MTATNSLTNLRHAMFERRPASARVTRHIEPIGPEEVALYRACFDGPSHASGVSDRHVIVIHLGHDVVADCVIGGARLHHRSAFGNVTIIPAGVEWAATLATRTEKIVLAIPIERVAVAAAMASRPSAGLRAQLRGQDPSLFSIARELWVGQAFGADDWHYLAEELVDRLIEVVEPGNARRLSPDAVRRLNAYLDTRLAEPITVETLADVVGEGRSNFPRLFRRSFGISPHQYLVRLRLRRARRLVRTGCSIAEATFEAGFAHQSHFTNWLRRLHGITPGSITRAPR